MFSLTGVRVDEENGVQVAQGGQGEAQEVLVRYAEVRTLEERKHTQGSDCFAQQHPEFQLQRWFEVGIKTKS